ncbi:hypothetical protein JRO89_XS07G0215400 [Xanthoceras sorbifolium]|uniref:Uncharacterized protein n=1 Tax=Xanthoceras sorbifolium TaxID=99658 RepID=A0ABQ8HUK5_9ROSI|nr:hypothetical protein JRO89_XS07G0215400 [Xanthoceras sorbifolium]
MEATDQASKASCIVIHTFQSLEIQVLDALSSMFLQEEVPTRGRDQQTNCRYACTEWGFGVEVRGEYDDGYVKRNEIEKVVRELMEGEKGHEMRNKAMDWKKMAEETTDTDGPSSINLKKLVVDNKPLVLHGRTVIFLQIIPIGKLGRKLRHPLPRLILEVPLKESSEVLASDEVANLES